MVMEGSKEEEEGMDVAAYDWLEVVVKGNGRGEMEIPCTYVRYLVPMYTHFVSSAA